MHTDPIGLLGEYVLRIVRMVGWTNVYLTAFTLVGEVALVVAHVIRSHTLSGDLITMTEASVDDLTVSRDSDGMLVAQETDLEDITDENGDPKTARIVPLTYGDTEEYFEDDEVEDLGAEVVATLMDEKLVSPDLTDHPDCPDDRVSTEFVRDYLPPLVPRSVLMALFRVSGMEAEVEMQEDGGAEVDISDEDSGN